MTQSAVDRLAQLRAARFAGEPPPLLSEAPRPKQRYRPPAPGTHHLLVRDVPDDTWSLIRTAARAQHMKVGELVLLILETSTEHLLTLAPRPGPKR